jgi:hypothetical protein
MSDINVCRERTSDESWIDREELSFHIPYHHR